jgi:hypothetical protein
MDVHRSSVENSSMQRGAVALIDALGFRGIWGRDPRKPSLQAFDTLKAVQAAVAAEILALGPLMKPARFPTSVRHLVKAPTITARFLSDTVVIAASVEPRKRAPRQKHENAAMASSGLDLVARNAAVDGFMRYAVCRCVCVALRAAALAAKPIAYRGAVSVGYFAIDENFILGPAVDEAAGLMEVADGALVWLAPSAERLKHIIWLKSGVRWSDLIIRADVPLSDGRMVHMNVINPFALSDAAEAKIVRKNLLGSMGSDRLDVVLKRQNTNRFFRAIDAATRLAAFKKKMVPRREPPPRSTSGAEGPEFDARRGTPS